MLGWRKFSHNHKEEFPLRTLTMEELEQRAEELPVNELAAQIGRLEKLIPPSSWDDLTLIIKEEAAFLARLMGCSCPESIAEALQAMAEQARALLEGGLLAGPSPTDLSELQNILASFNDAADTTIRAKLNRRECTVNPDDETIVCFCDEHFHYYPA